MLPEGYLVGSVNDMDARKTLRSWGLEEGMSRRAEKLKEQEEKDRSKQVFFIQVRAEKSESFLLERENKGVQ